MRLTLRPEQERVLLEAVKAGLAHTKDEAVDLALDALRMRLPEPPAAHEESAPELAKAVEEWEVGLDAWLDSFPQSPLLPDSAFQRETWYPDRW